MEIGSVEFERGTTPGNIKKTLEQYKNEIQDFEVSGDSGNAGADKERMALERMEYEGFIKVVRW